MEDENLNVRRTALSTILTENIDASNAAILVKILEDPSGLIVNDALERLFSIPIGSDARDVDAIANAIIEELILILLILPHRVFFPNDPQQSKSFRLAYFRAVKF